MRPEQLSVALRQRDPWEAMDLGIALWRRHFAAIMGPWLALSLPVLALACAAGWWLDTLWAVPLLMWWLKPWFDRAPLYVLSRAVFGTVPGLRQVLRARELRSPGLFAWLSWRRLHPARSLLLPVDLLEGAGGARRALRVTVLQRAVSGQAVGLLAVCWGMQLAVLLSLLSLGLMFVPSEFLSESARAMWATMFEAPPPWAQLLGIVMWWSAISLVEPVYIASGFGLYLNRRTQLEAWDVELVFRRLAARAQSLAGVAASWLGAALLLGALCLPAPARAATPAADKATTSDEVPTLTPAQLLGESARAPDPRFARALERAYADPSLARTRAVTHWQLRTPLDREDESKEPPEWLKAIGAVLAAIGEYGLWALAAALLLFVLWRLPRWLPWVRRQWQGDTPLPPVVEQPLSAPPPLPDDIPAAASALWREGRQRDALALLYRASVTRLAQRLGTPFPPGATEAECLRRARRLDDADARGAFNEVVRTWQRAAYARQFPDAEAFATLLAGWAQRFPEAA